MAPESRKLDLASTDAGRWFAVAVGSIAVAGSFALYLAVARIPGLETLLIPDPKFGWRALIVHVNLALGVWFSAFTAGLFCLLPGATRVRVTPLAQILAVVGVIAFSATLFVESAEPVRSNYVPALDHWLFLFGIGLFGAAIGLGFFDPRMIRSTLPSQIPADAQAGLRAAAIAYLAAMATFGAAWATQPQGLLPLAYYERVFWGGGHLLQFANVLAMVGAWLFLLSKTLGRPVLKASLSAILATLLLLPCLSGPVVVLADGSPQVFTELMRWGIFPAVSAFIVLCAHALWRARGSLAKGALRSAAFVGFLTSACMTVAGFILGSLIRDNNTLVPGHYHMSIGAVTAAFMAALIVLLEPLGAPLPTARLRSLAVWQPLLFGGGQAVMAIGFAIAGVAGAERKAYGSEQVVRSTGEWIGLSIMGLGGVLASVGGVVFLVLVAKAYLHRRKSAH
ncbi:MAG: cbb3-type cytochrome c oxidase subunit I [Planctomycetes bacterium]|nr:cbb3-type cytochrome c oxidase subunit I [Planctomycetota bacterium]